MGIKEKRILVTGGAGYIGSHTCTLLLQDGYDVTVVDNLCNSSVVALDRIGELAGCQPKFIRADLRDAMLLEEVLQSQQFDAVIHFAGLKAVGESVSRPVAYFDNNVSGTVNLLKAMDRANVKTFVFSSSATVYGDPQSLPLTEKVPCSGTANPYGRTKLMVEDILADLYASDSEWRIARLRYFNPVGAHPSGRIGEDPRGVPNNLMPYISQVAGGTRECLSVYGNDYPTPDGTGVRDYIHVMDLAQGHLAALDYLSAKVRGELLTTNLGTGRGISVLEMVNAFVSVTGQNVPYKIVERRPGDVACCYADASLAGRLLGWRATRGVEEMCADTWRWQSMNPHGFATA